MLEAKHSAAAKWSAHVPLEASMLQKCLNGYADDLREQGYAARTIQIYARCVAHFAQWLGSQGTRCGEIDAQVFHRFVDQHLPRCRCAQCFKCARTDVRAALGHLLQMLESRGGVAAPRPTTPAAISAELEQFDQHLLEVRGLTPVTRAVRLRHLRSFLVEHFGNGPIDLRLLKPADVAQFVLRITVGLSAGSIKVAGVSLRSYFAFRAIRGDPTTALRAAIPIVPQWRLARLPKMLSTSEINRFLQAFDRQHVTGRRDYAIARCLVDLGLRRAEVAQLCLDDIDWRAGTVRLHGKGRRFDMLPLPDLTGRAIAQYLQHGRPATTRREVFVRHRPPINAPADLDIVRNAVRYAARRCGLEDRIRGTHLLRHTLAGRLVQRGARFKDIADLLRHRNLDTTTIYAKVDLPALARVALPWPGRSE